MEGRSPLTPTDLGLNTSLSPSTSMARLFGSTCALTILKGDADHPVNARAPIHQKERASKPSTPATNPPRFASSFSSLRSASNAASSGFDSTVNVHAVADHGILLPFLDRPTEVKELLFDTKANEALMYRLCRVFGGDPERPTQRGCDERWDEMLELLTELDRPLLDDEDWLVRLESLVMERSPELWAQLARCLGAEGLTLHPSAQPASSRFDSWALPSRYSLSRDNDSPLSAPSPSSSSGDEDGAHRERSLSVSVEPLDNLPQSFSQQPAGKMHSSSLRDAASPMEANESSSPAEPFAMSAGDESGAPGSLEDIMEEPSLAAQADRSASRRPRSHSGKFAGLRISAMTSVSPPASRRTSVTSASLAAASSRDASPLPTGEMSPAGRAATSPARSPSRGPSASFSKHRRLSTMMMQNNTSHQPRSSHDSSPSTSPKASIGRRQRGVSEATAGGAHAGHHHRQPRRRAQSFARSFAELKSPTEHLEQLRADHAQAEADRLADDTRRISLQDGHLAQSGNADNATSGALGLHGDSLSVPKEGKPAKAATRRLRVGSMGSRASVSSTGSTSPSLPGLLPDGRTRHPSGSFGSRDLSESIAAFRATMGMSTSPAPSETNFADNAEASSDADQSTSSAARKRKGSGGAELPKPTSRTAEIVEAKVSRTGSPRNNEQAQDHLQQPKHMQELESRNRAAGGGGSGLALGGGFSFAKSGANFRAKNHDDAPTSQGGWRSSFARRDGPRSRGEPYSYRSPPAVHRRPGGFVSLAQEYERARSGRRASESVFSFNSNALASSPSSSQASFDHAGDGSMPRARQASSEDPIPRLELTVAPDSSEASMRKGSTPDVGKGEPTPKAGPGGGITPRASFTTSTRPPSREAGHGYPFPNLLSRRGPSEELKADSSSTLAPATPLSPLQACHTHLGATPPAARASPRSPSIVFPISPNPALSRAREFSRAVETPRCQDAFARIRSVCGDETASGIRALITTAERAELPDESLLEEVAHRLGLVDHERARMRGGHEAEHADVKLAEEGYAERWHAFADLCSSLGVGQYELSMAKRRCGPAIDLCG
ncbi:uncharacterized protein PSANT_04483 [Moesziomyces antarcticus]|nr:uncharacterized protein PSANT_04483 [Moesziomyces antarcticus]